MSNHCLIFISYSGLHLSPTEWFSRVATRLKITLCLKSTVFSGVTPVFW
jgi:hypothetical protein